MTVDRWLLAGCFSDLKRIARLLYSTPGFPGCLITCKSLPQCTLLGLWYVLHAYLGQENWAICLPFRGIARPI